MLRLVGSAGSFAWSYAARASGPVGTDAHATRSSVDTIAGPRVSIAAAADSRPDREAFALIGTVPFVVIDAACGWSRWIPRCCRGGGKDAGAQLDANLPP